MVLCNLSPLEIIGKLSNNKSNSAPTGTAAFRWAVALALVTALMAFALSTSLPVTSVLITGLMIFGIVFAINSSLHSYLIVNYAKEDGASLDVGFYYMANAMGRLIGTVLSGYLYQTGGIIACLWVTTGFLAIVCVISLLLPKNSFACAISVIVSSALKGNRPNYVVNNVIDSFGYGRSAHSF